MAPTLLWVGGSSGLAQTFFEEGFARGADWICTGVEHEAPTWLEGVAQYVRLDLTSRTSVSTLFERIPRSVHTLIVGVRMHLVGGDAHTSLLSYLELLVASAAAVGVRRVLHISSVAAADHLRAQCGVSESEPLPPLAEYRGEYDVFKRRSEEVIADACEAAELQQVHLRLSGIFSNEPRCVQVNALALQVRAGAYLPALIDLNSSRNVAVAMSLLLSRGSPPPHRLYYYTRRHGAPVPYGERLAAYRRAHRIRAAVWIPSRVVAALVAFFHVLVRRTPLRRLGVARAVDYLLQVSQRDHSFDNARIHADFPELAALEESDEDAFARIDARRRIEARKVPRCFQADH